MRVADILAAHRARVAAELSGTEYVEPPHIPGPPMPPGKPPVPRCKHLNLGFVALMKKGLTMQRVLASGHVTPEVYEARMAACLACDHVSERRGKHYCECCGCPRWRVAALENKNLYVKHLCSREPRAF
jgi:hypothetical protein